MLDVYIYTIKSLCYIYEFICIINAQFSRIQCCKQRIFADAARYLYASRTTQACQTHTHTHMHSTRAGKSLGPIYQFTIYKCTYTYKDYIVCCLYVCMYGLCVLEGCCNAAICVCVFVYIQGIFCVRVLNCGTAACYIYIHS